jgi:glycosyltransferase involved in cell wall biosynthesis
MDSPSEPRNIAVVHDWLVDFSGAERVLEQILSLYPRATLYTLIDRMPQPERARLASARTVTSFLDRLPAVQRYFTRTLPLMPLAVQQFDLSGHDLVISSSHCVAKGVIAPPDALHLCMCYSPMRYAWDMQGPTLRTEGLDRGLKGVLARLMMHRLRQWDATSTNGVDHIAADSRFVQGRVLKAWRRESVVIHPPVRLPPSSAVQASREPGRYVTVGRLMGYKNVALMLEAFSLLPQHRLHVVGTGPLERALRRRAPANVRFLGALSDEGVQQELQAASGFVFAAVEDFGIAPVEALAAGTPVIAYGRGGALDYLQHGANAWLFHELTPQALADAVRAAEAGFTQDVQTRCRSSAERFRGERFRAEFRAWVDACWAAWQPQRGPVVPATA